MTPATDHPDNAQVDAQRVVSLTHTDAELTVEFADGHTSRFNRFWLRDNCPTAGNKLTAIRHFFLRSLTPALHIQTACLDAGDVVIEFRHDAHISRFAGSWLRAHCCEVDSRRRRTHRPVLWGQALQHNLPSVEGQTLTVDSPAHLKLLEHLVDYGFVRITGLPIEPDGIEQLEPLLAPFTSNDFGRIFDLISEPDVWDLSQSTEALDPHTDDPYRYAPPGIRILYCLASSGDSGGESIMVNGLAAAEDLRTRDASAFELLSRTAVSYVRHREDAVEQGDYVHLRAEAPVITLTPDGDVAGIRFHERSMAPLSLPPERVDDYYLALIKLSERINSGAFGVQHLLMPGEAFVFDNQHVLHGRTAFTQSPGRRHLRLCQMDRDLVHSRYRLLMSRHGRDGASHFLRSGV